MEEASIEEEIKVTINNLEKILEGNTEIRRLGPYSKKETSIVFVPDKCKFSRTLLITYKDEPYLTYPLCLHPVVYSPEHIKDTSTKRPSESPFSIASAELPFIFRQYSPTKGEYYTEDVMCSPDNCVFFKKLANKKYVEKNLDLLESSEPVETKELRFRPKFDIFWKVPPSDFNIFAGYKIITNEESRKIGEKYEY